MDRIATRVSDLLGVRYPIVQAPMGWIARSRLASAVSNAGGLGIIETSSGELDVVKDEIRKMRDLTDRPFGVNIAQLFVRDPSIVDFVVGQGVKFVTTSAGDPRKYTGQLKAAGLTVFHVVPSLDAALKAVDAGVDGLVVEGGEGGGFKNPRDVATMVLLPLVREHVDVPLIAAGGITYSSTREVAALAFREGELKFPAKLRAGAHVESSAGGQGMFAIDGRRVVLQVRELSSLRIESDTKVVLDRGEIWCDVVTNSGRFEIQTPQGSVTVTGTKFGVEVSDSGTRVLLHEGRVIVRGARDGNAMTPGTQAFIAPNSDAPEFTPAPEDVRPAWSSDLLKRAAEDAVTRYYPSGAPGRN